MKEIKKDITHVTLGIIAHGVNCQRVMNSGVARTIRQKWPVVYEKYKSLPMSGKALLGTTQFVSVSDNDSLWVANCFTQLFYGYGGGKYASIPAIKSSLHQTFKYADFYSLPVYLPKIGCGLGGLDWDTEVKPIVEKLDDEFDRIDTFVCIFP